MNPDGWTIERTNGTVTLLLSNRYGEQVQYEFTPTDAHLLGAALIHHATD
jgi:hypothetical protein